MFTHICQIFHLFVIPHVEKLSIYDLKNPSLQNSRVCRSFNATKIVIKMQKCRKIDNIKITQTLCRCLINSNNYNFLL